MAKGAAQQQRCDAEKAEHIDREKKGGGRGAEKERWRSGQQIGQEAKGETSVGWYGLSNTSSKNKHGQSGKNRVEGRGLSSGSLVSKVPQR